MFGLFNKEKKEAKTARKEALKEKKAELKDRTEELMDLLNVPDKKNDRLLNRGDFKKLAEELFDGEVPEAKIPGFMGDSGGTVFLTNKRVIAIYLMKSGLKNVKSIPYSKITSIDSTDHAMTIHIGSEEFEVRKTIGANAFAKKIREKQMEA